MAVDGRAGGEGAEAFAGAAGQQRDQHAVQVVDVGQRSVGHDAQFLGNLATSRLPRMFWNPGGSW
jgi:hypothetical protein